MNIRISDFYKSYKPSFDVRAAVERLVNGLPEEHWRGLHSIALNEHGALNYNRRREKTRSRGRKVRIAETRGLYHARWKGDPACIELFVDSILANAPVLIRWIPLLQDLALSETVFHELGHHIHATQAPARREREDVADAWMERLERSYYRRRYWYLVPAGILSWGMRRALYGSSMNRWRTMRAGTIALVVKSLCLLGIAVSFLIDKKEYIILCVFAAFIPDFVRVLLVTQSGSSQKADDAGASKSGGA